MASEFKLATLANGLTIIAEADPHAHTASVGFFVRTGARDEKTEVMGVSHFLEHMMFKGTARRSADDVNREFDAMGARANAYTGQEITAFFASVLPEQLPKATDLLADMMRPALREADFDTEKGVILEEIAMYKDEPFWVLYERLMEAHFKDHPLSHRVLGTTESITALRVGQMRDYFNHRYSADTTTVAMAGRVDFDAAVEQIGALCGSWPRTGAERDERRPSYGLGTIDLKDERLSRAYRMQISEAPASDDPRRYAASVLGEVLGGQDNSRLHWGLIEPGIAEEASASYDPRDGVGDFRVMVVAEPDAMEEAWAVADREIRGLAAGVTQRDVDMVRAKIATGVTVAGEKPEGRMHRIGRLWTLNREYSTMAQELERVNAVTAEDVRALLAEYPLARATMGTLRP
ncbi:MAG TPA: pitrilysin family protein [Phycisphaerales bacterium]|nr:pitrilysin family protein [Phycisphaerales bacterium]